MHNEREENSITRPRETGQTQRLARWAIGIGLVSLTVGIVSGVAQRLAKPLRELTFSLPLTPSDVDVVRSLAQITRKLETHSSRNYSGGNQAAACDEEASGTIAG